MASSLIWSKQAQREYILQSFYVFCRDTEMISPIYVHPHKELCDELQECEPNFGSRIQHKKLVLAPRGTYKTSLVEAFITYLIIKYPDIRIALGRATDKLAVGLLFAVKQKLKNPVIIELFGDLSTNAPIWAADQIVINTRTRAWHEPTVFTYGLGTSLTGQHFDVVFGDDFVHENNYMSEAALLAGQITIQSMFPVLEKHGSAILTGTFWQSNDLYSWVIHNDNILEQEAEAAGVDQPSLKREWKLYIRSAYNPDGSLYAPELLPEETLNQRRRSMTAKLFASWYLNQPFEEGMKVFSRISQRDFDYFPQPWPIIVYEDKQLVRNIPVYVTMTIDPALMNSAHNDEMGVTIVGTDSEDVWWILHAEGFRKLPSEQASHILYLVRKYQPRRVCVESAGADAEFVGRISVGINELNDSLELQQKIMFMSYSALRDEARGERGKTQRIEALEPRFREYKAWLRRGHTKDLYRQLDTWPNVLNKHDDVVDALSMQRKVAIRATTSATMASYEELEKREEVLSWGPEGPLQKLTGKVIAQVGVNSQALRG